jgi:hypothetical protein
MLQRSYGWNLGIAYLPDARPASAADIAGAPDDILDAIARADAVLQNGDRTARNPNLLKAAGRLRAIDYDACLYLSRALGPARPPVTTLPSGHLLAGRTPKGPLPALDLAALVAAAPAEWIEAAGTDRTGLTGALARYIAAWDQPR